jgi:O-antigen/teichoic acid export membrane protein
MIRTTLLTLTALAPLGMGYTAARSVAWFRSTDRERVGRILGLCAVMSALVASVATLGLAIGASRLATDVLGAPHLAVGLKVVAGAVFFTVMSQYQIGALTGLESHRALAAAGMLTGALSLAVCSLAAWVGGLTGALAGVSVSAAIQWIAVRSCLAPEIARRAIPVRYGGLGREGRLMVEVALPAALIGFVSMPALWLASTLLVRQPGGYEQMALYGAANSFRMMVLLTTTVINSVGMSALSHQKGLADVVRYRQVFWLNMGLTAGVVVIGASIVIVLGPWLLLIFGRSFEESYPVLVVLMIATIPEGLSAATLQAIHAEGKMWLSLFAIVIPRDGAMALLSYLLSPSYGAVGLAAAQGTAWLLALVVSIYVARRTGLGVTR